MRYGQEACQMQMTGEQCRRHQVQHPFLLPCPSDTVSLSSMVKSHTLDYTHCDMYATAESNETNKSYAVTSLQRFIALRKEVQGDMQVAQVTHDRYVGFKARSMVWYMQYMQEACRVKQQT